jgi:hypothetical protein
MAAFGHRAGRAQVAPNHRGRTEAAADRPACYLEGVPHRRLAWLPVLLTLAGLGAWARPARACSCLPPPPPTIALEQSDFVFEGRAFSTRVVGQMAEFSFEVDRVWKGDVEAQLSLQTAQNSAACGRNYQIGQSYLIYARHGSEGAIFDGLCSRTRTIAAAGEDLEHLGPGRDVGPARRRQAPPPSASDVPREPPRIESPPPAVEPATPGRRGCRLEMPHTNEGALAGLWLGLAVAVGRRRRVRSPGAGPTAR